MTCRGRHRQPRHVTAELPGDGGAVTAGFVPLMCVTSITEISCNINEQLWYKKPTDSALFLCIGQRVQVYSKPKVRTEAGGVGGGGQC